jgi:predicted DNA binding CopG/RHH family protein
MNSKRIQIDLSIQAIEILKIEASKKGTNKKNLIENIIERKAKKLNKPT